MKSFSLFDNTGSIISNPLDYDTISQTESYKNELQSTVSKPLTTVNPELIAHKIVYNIFLWAISVLVLNTLSQFPGLAILLQENPLILYTIRGIYCLFGYNIVSGIFVLWHYSRSKKGGVIKRSTGGETKKTDSVLPGSLLAKFGGVSASSASAAITSNTLASSNLSGISSNAIITGTQNRSIVVSPPLHKNVSLFTPSAKCKYEMRSFE